MENEGFYIFPINNGEEDIIFGYDEKSCSVYLDASQLPASALITAIHDLVDIPTFVHNEEKILFLSLKWLRENWKAPAIWSRTLTRLNELFDDRKDEIKKRVEESNANSKS